METVRETIGKCPLGYLVKETKIDIFGFIFSQKVIKVVLKDWYFFNLFEEGERGITYSDRRFYSPHNDYHEVTA